MDFGLVGGPRKGRGAGGERHCGMYFRGINCKCVQGIGALYEVDGGLIIGFLFYLSRPRGESLIRLLT